MSQFSTSSESSINHGAVGKDYMVALICAIASPLTYAVANTVDKIVISKRVHCTAGYTPYVGIIDIIIGLLIGYAGDWSKSTLESLKIMDYVYPLLSGICLGVCAALYFFALEWAEVSRVVGLESIYPLFVTLWSYIFLDDTIESIGYIGIFFATFGGIVMSFDALRILFNCAISNIKSCSEFKESYFEKEERKKAEAESNDADSDDYGASWMFCRIYGVPYRLRDARSVSPDNDYDDADDIVNKEKLRKALLDSSKNIINVDDDDIDHIPESDDEEEMHGSYGSVHNFGMIKDKKKSVKEYRKEKLLKKKNDKKSKFEMVKNVLMLIPIPIAMSGNDFFAKVSVSGMPVNNVSALNSIGFGSVLVLFAFSREGRKHFLDEVKYNWFYGIISEFLTILSTYLVIVGMTGLSAPIVSALSSLRPFFLLISETALRISTDSVYQCIGFKLFPILFIVAGVILITFSVVSD